MQPVNKRRFMLTIFIITIVSVVLLSASMAVSAAPIRNHPMTLTQPDGNTLECFASGDEFFNYLHDSNGNLIIQHPDTGYYVYVTLDSSSNRLCKTE